MIPLGDITTVNGYELPPVSGRKRRGHAVSFRTDQFHAHTNRTNRQGKLKKPPSPEERQPCDKSDFITGEGALTMKKRNGETVESMIRKAVEAGRLSAERSPKDAYRATERRLYALPDIRAKLADDRETLADVKKYGVKNKSHSVTRFMKSGVRLTPEEALAAVVMDLEAGIAAGEHEIQVMERALASIADDEYSATVTGKYIDRLTDEEIAERIPCDPTTVWRNRKRLVQRLSVRLYGVEAVK